LLKSRQLALKLQAQLLLLLLLLLLLQHVISLQRVWLGMHSRQVRRLLQ
jgi:hypothetical protein